LLQGDISAAEVSLRFKSMPFAGGILAGPAGLWQLDASLPWARCARPRLPSGRPGGPFLSTIPLLR